MAPFVMDKTIPEGAATTVWACVAPEITTDDYRGAYLADCEKFNLGPVAEDADGKLRAALWLTTQEQIQDKVKNF